MDASQSGRRVDTVAVRLSTTNAPSGSVLITAVPTEADTQPPNDAARQKTSAVRSNELWRVQAMIVGMIGSSCGFRVLLTVPRTVPILSDDVPPGIVRASFGRLARHRALTAGRQ